MASDEAIAAKLHSWAIQEMHFHPQGRHVNTILPNATAMASSDAMFGQVFWNNIIQI
jgi:hypothetical protein